MHHEPNTQTLMNWAETEPYGQINNVLAKAGYFDTRTNHWKQIKELGGGAMYDMGVYPLNAIRYTKGKEPISVSAKHITKRPEIYYEVDETTIFDLKFSDGTIAHGETSLGEHFNNLEATCEEGSYFLKPFQSYSGVQGATSDGEILKPWKGNQQAKQMDDDALAILNHQPMLVPGEEGMKDIHIVEKIYESASKNSSWISI